MAKQRPVIRRQRAAKIYSNLLAAQEAFMSDQHFSRVKFTSELRTNAYFYLGEEIGQRMENMYRDWQKETGKFPPPYEAVTMLIDFCLKLGAEGAIPKPMELPSDAEDPNGD